MENTLASFQWVTVFVQREIHAWICAAYIQTGEVSPAANKKTLQTAFVLLLSEARCEEACLRHQVP